jgi:hypothetical protein
VHEHDDGLRIRGRPGAGKDIERETVSLISIAGRVPLLGGNHPPSFCVHRAEYLSARRTPSHFSAGCGARQRSSPIGGAA